MLSKVSKKFGSANRSKPQKSLKVLNHLQYSQSRSFSKKQPNFQYTKKKQQFSKNIFSKIAFHNISPRNTLNIKINQTNFNAPRTFFTLNNNNNIQSQNKFFLNKMNLLSKPQFSYPRYASNKNAGDQLEARLRKTNELFPALHLKDGIEDANRALEKIEKSDKPTDVLESFVRHLCSTHDVPASTSGQLSQMIDSIRNVTNKEEKIASAQNTKIDLDKFKPFLTKFPELLELSKTLQENAVEPPPVTVSQEHEDKIYKQNDFLIGEVETAIDYLQKNTQELAQEKSEIDHYIENIDILTVHGELRKRPALIEKIDEDIVYDRWSHDEEED